MYGCCSYLLAGKYVNSVPLIYFADYTLLSYFGIRSFLSLASLTSSLEPSPIDLPPWRQNRAIPISCMVIVSTSIMALGLFKVLWPCLAKLIAERPNAWPIMHTTAQNYGNNLIKLSIGLLSGLNCVILAAFHMPATTWKEFMSKAVLNVFSMLFCIFSQVWQEEPVVSMPSSPNTSWMPQKLPPFSFTMKALVLNL